MRWNGFWESRLPELFSENYNFFVGKAEYISNTQLEAWKAITLAHSALDSVLTFERELTRKFGERKFSFETRGKLTQKNYSREFARAYHDALSGMVERHMRICIRRIGSFWYTAWVDAGQPDLKTMLEHKPTEEELAQRRAELEEWKKAQFAARPHE